jgi:hypothetical protein
VTIALSLAGFLILTNLVIPGFRSEAHQVFSKRYSALGEDVGAIARTFVLRPDVVLDLIGDRAKIRVLAYALLPLAFLPLMSFSAALLILPGVAEVLLTEVRSLKQLTLLYPYVVMPLFTVAAVWGLWRIAARLPESRRTQALRLGSGAVLVLSLAAMLLYDHERVARTPASHPYHRYYLQRFPLSRGFSLEYFLSNEHERIGRRFIRERVPPRVPLSAEYRFAGRVADRDVLEPLSNLDRSELILMDVHGQTYVESADELKTPLRRTDFGVVAFEDGFTLMRRGAEPSANRRVLDLIDRRFEGETLAGDTGESMPDHRAVNRMARVARTRRHPPGLLAAGTLLPLAPGRYTALVRLRAGKGASAREQEIATIEVRDENAVLVARRKVVASDLPSPGIYAPVRLPFTWTAGDSLAVRVGFPGAVDLFLDCIVIEGG